MFVRISPKTLVAVKCIQSVRVVPEADGYAVKIYLFDGVDFTSVGYDTKEAAIKALQAIEDAIYEQVRMQNGVNAQIHKDIAATIIEAMKSAEKEEESGGSSEAQRASS